MDIVFMASSEYALPALHAIIQAGHRIALAVTQPDRPSSRRGLKPVPNAVKKAARELGLPLAQPEGASDPALLNAAQSCGAAVVCAYGQLLGESLLRAPLYGSLNIHFSLLPRHRGAAPVQRAIMEGDRVFGLSIMQMGKGLDTGDVLMRRSFPLPEGMAAWEAFGLLANEGASAIVQVLERCELGTSERSPQDESLATYAKKIEKSERRVRFSSPARAVHNQIRALDASPGAYGVMEGRHVLFFDSSLVAEGREMAEKPGTVLGERDGRLLIAAEGGILGIGRLKAEGKGMVAGHEFFRGLRGNASAFSSEEAR
ncbi:MAG: methionyl-tRNA formyltransferase [Eubacteriaceae bacterium]|nr:methionyl-tRNA formyltransferase [Eubacteriaceae bacterium]